MVEMQQVQSSNVEAVGYDAAAAELHVQYLSSPAVYVYQGVPEDVFERLLNSPSVGSFLHAEVKGVYPFYKK